VIRDQRTGVVQRLALQTLGLVFLAGAAQAGPLYRWVDDQGKTHFSDKPPANQPGENISGRLAPLNIGETGAAIKGLQDVFSAPGAQEKAFQARQDEQRQRQLVQLEQQCNKARQILAKLRGPVLFVDEDGTAIAIPEKERADRERQLAAEIAARCY